MRGPYPGACFGHFIEGYIHQLSRGCSGTEVFGMSFYVFAQEKVINGLSAGAVKG
jgi:hypothetical protein